MEALPLILAGPIVRRVEPDLVAVWVALKEPRVVRLSVWKGLKSTGTGDTIFGDDDPDFADDTETVRVGDNLHVAVVIAVPPVAMIPEVVYSYNVAFGDISAESFSATADLKSLSLLKDGTVDSKPHLALGYAPGFLPSFSLPPMEVTNLRILHGSCRRINTELEDGLSWVDELIEPSRTDAIGRPHQLFLSGDQIYADDVASPLLPQLIKRGNELMGNSEYLPTIWPAGFPEKLGEKTPKPSFFPADKRHFPPAIRHRLLDAEAFFTTKDHHSHLISFGEFSAMYLFVWSNVLWNVEELKDFDDIVSEIKSDWATIPGNYGAVFRERKRVKGDIEIEKELLDKFINFIIKTLTAEELRDALKTQEKVEKDRSPLNTDHLTPDCLKLLLEASNEKLKGKNQFVAIHKFATSLSKEELKNFKVFFKTIQDQFGGLYKKVEEDADKRKLQVTKFYNGLAKVRRALANVATYMMFDDHEVTDDWYLNPMWRERAFASPLGTAILRNGLLAYAVFQDWGNSPSRYLREAFVFDLKRDVEKNRIDLDKSTISEDVKRRFLEREFPLGEKVTIEKDGSNKWLIKDPESKTEFVLRNDANKIRVFRIAEPPQYQLLQLIPSQFTAANNKIKQLDLTVTTKIDKLLGLDDKDPPVKWHFSVRGPQHLVLALDNRTRRSFVTINGPPGNIALKAMKQQVPKAPRPGVEVVIVVAPLPVLGPPVFDEVIAPLAYRMFDIIAYSKGDKNVRSGMAGTNPDAIEAWAFDPPTLEELLKRLATYKKVVLLSGDVHYGSSQALSYWRKKDTKPARFAQFTSSGLRNVMPSYIQLVSQGFPFAQKMVRAKIGSERLGWDSDFPDPLNFSGASRPKVPALRSKLRQNPVLLPTDGWPDGTAVARPPDWSWRLHVIRDERPDQERPEATRPEPITLDVDLSTESVVDDYRKIATRHARQLDKMNQTRHILFTSNLGEVRFEKKDKILAAVHHLHAYPLNINEATKPEIYTIHRVELEAPTERKPKLKTNAEAIT